MYEVPNSETDTVKVFYQADTYNDEKAIYIGEILMKILQPHFYNQLRNIEQLG